MTGELSRTAEVAQRLIRFPSVNHGAGVSDGEADAAGYLEAQLAALGLAPQLFEPEPGRVSVVARVEGETPGPALVVHGHTDVVPADQAGWTVDPFAGLIRDGMLWGRGAVDMKGMDAMMLAALERLLASGRRPASDLVIAYFADEESGGVRGSHWVVDHHPELFAGATEAISEVGGYSIDLAGRRAYLLQTGEKALVWATVTARGRAAHGSRYVQDTAIDRLAGAIVDITAHDWPVTLTTTTRELVDRLGELLGVDPQAEGPDGVVLRTGSAAGFVQATLRTTVNTTVLRAGAKHNVVPDTASAALDIRTLPGDEEAVLERLRSIVGDGVEITIDHADIGLENPFGGSLVDEVIRLLDRHDPGAPVLPYLMPGGTDNKALAKLGIAGYGFAPLRLPADLDFPAMFHGPDERVPLDALEFGTDVLTDLFAEYRPGAVRAGAPGPGGAPRR